MNQNKSINSDYSRQNQLTEQKTLSSCKLGGYFSLKDTLNSERHKNYPLAQIYGLERLLEIDSSIKQAVATVLLKKLEGIRLTSSSPIDSISKTNVFIQEAAFIQLIDEKIISLNECLLKYEEMLVESSLAGLAPWKEANLMIHSSEIYPVKLAEGGIYFLPSWKEKSKNQYILNMSYLIFK